MFKLVFDPNHPYLSDMYFYNADWSEFYEETSKDILQNAPKNRGKFAGNNLFRIYDLHWPLPNDLELKTLEYCIF